MGRQPRRFGHGDRVLRRLARGAISAVGGDLVLLMGVGAGYVGGAALLRWLA